MNNDPHRRTGRTFRMILRAVLEASDGRPCVVLLDGYDYARATSEKTWDICRHHAERKVGGRILFESGGSIVFRSKQSHTAEKEHQRLRQGALLFNDHFDRQQP